MAAVACNGDDSSPASGSPSPEASPNANATVTVTPIVTPIVTPGSGIQPVQAIITYIEANGLDGHQLDLASAADCPIQEMLATPDVTSVLVLGQFCLTAKGVEPQRATTIVLELPDTGEMWEMKLEFDADVSLWKVKDVDKVSG